jgi:hypothetical protein
VCFILLLGNFTRSGLSDFTRSLPDVWERFYPIGPLIEFQSTGNLFNLLSAVELSQNIKA